MYLQRNLFILIRLIPFFSLSQLFLRSPQHPGSYLLISPGRSVISWGVGVHCKPPYSTAPRSPPSRAPKLSERLPPRAVPGPPTQLLLPGSAAATPAATPATAGTRQAWAQGPLRSRVSTWMDGWMDNTTAWNAHRFSRTQFWDFQSRLANTDWREFVPINQTNENKWPRGGGRLITDRENRITSENKSGLLVSV